MVQRIKKTEQSNRACNRHVGQNQLILVTRVPEEEEGMEAAFEDIVAEEHPHLMKIANHDAHKLQIE